MKLHWFSISLIGIETLLILALLGLLGMLLRIERLLRLNLHVDQRLRLPPWPLRLAGLVWVLALLLALIGLLTGCASPCQPTLDPSQLKRLIEANPPPPWWDLGIGIDCAWRF